MGADGAATLGAMGMLTVRQPVKKLYIVDKGSSPYGVIGTSGPVGMGQQYHGLLQDLLRSESFSSDAPAVAMGKLQRKLWPACETALKASAILGQVVGNQAAQQNSLASAIVGVPVKNDPRLFQFGPQCNAEEVTDALPFVAIGSGQPIADPFMAFIRRVFWPDRLPTLFEGIFAVFWTLDHAIETAAFGLGSPKQIVILRKHSGGYEIRELPDTELQEHSEAIADAEARLQSCLSEHAPETG